MNNIKYSMKLIFSAMRISISLTLFTVCILMSANFFGFIPNEYSFLLESRKKESEAIAVQFLILDPVSEIAKHKELIRYLVKNNREVLSAAIRSESGEIIYQSISHGELWGDDNSVASNATHINIPLIKNDNLVGNVELRFKALKTYSISNIIEHPILKIGMFFLFSGFLVYFVFMIRILREINFSAIP